ncbi:MAG: GNAT family N-acetyltransferase [Bacteroidales bacterium]|nr:GNAT family N-acetyltransferase [Bacteroidales bacterium]
MNKLNDLPDIIKKDFTNKEATNIISSAKKELLEGKINTKYLYIFLNYTGKINFLCSLKSQKKREEWANLVFEIIQKTEYSLLSMIKQRVDEHPEKILFKDRSKPRVVEWTYKQVFHHIKEIAAFIYSINKKNPKVALYMNNSIEGAISDLACLSYDIFNTPLNIHFNEDILKHIIEKLNIDIIITDTSERLKIVTAAVKNIDKKIKIIVTHINTAKNKDADYFLSKECKKISLQKADEILNKRERKKINQVATTMFTSGSTGMPKGVSFSIYNIISKRFARAAALPQVGKNEKLICYLPLFHTFGRFLELTGTIFWGGTYIFAGNSSSATLLSLFPKEHPTGFISVPIRWGQIYEKCIKATEGIEDEKEQQKVIKSITGKNLHWGLSAAGYLDPKIFRYFHKHGITLNSGFGMTEATGGITMTPSYDYKENSTGIPLPGTKTRLKENGELEIKSHYLAKYLEDAGPEDIIPYPHEEDYWLSTGDIFKIDNNGHHEIIDRVKDIYKNNKGQTIAPGMIEKKFAGVPGIKQTFLIGDGKPYNVLLIVPDFEDPVLTSGSKDDNINEYFHQIITTANKDSAPYERVINFSIANREFLKEKGEITAKGSFKRKNIEKNFSELISKLYEKDFILIKKKNFEIVIPRWFYRDIGILETDIISDKEGIYNKVTKQKLRIQKSYKENIYLIGDLEYKIYDKKVDLGIIVRQPKLWAGNPELISFSPCKVSFDLPLKNISPQLRVPKKDIRTYHPGEIPQILNIIDADLTFLNTLLSETLHSDTKTSLISLKQIEKIFTQSDKNKAEIIRRRLEALACHKDEEIRVSAYRILLTKDPEPNFSELLPAFINSGKTFLNEQSIRTLAKNTFAFQHFDSLRKRMFHYRNEMKWPADKQTRKQFDTIFRLLLNFGINHPKYYKSIRAEFASWMLLKNEPVLSKKAHKYFYELFEGFKKQISKTSKIYTEKEWKSLLVFDEGISEDNKKELTTKLASSNTLKQALILIYDEYNFDLKLIAKNNIWVSRVKSYRNTKHYRMSINTKKGKHYDLHIAIDEKLKTQKGLETLYRMIAIGGYPFDSPSLTIFGCSNPSEKIIISGYLSMLTAWDKIRAIAEMQAFGQIEQANTWRKIYIRSMSAFFRVWHNSNQEIMPGFVSPGNVALPENDFSDNSVVISLSGWNKNAQISSLISAMLKNFYKKATAHYPLLKKHIKTRWIYHACVEALGEKKSRLLFKKLISEYENKPALKENELEIYETLKEYLKDFKGRIYLPLALFNAIDRYSDWVKKSKKASITAKEQTIAELFDLYALGKFPEIIRYKFYRETFFKDSDKEVVSYFDILINKMSENINHLPIQLTELSDLQSVLKNSSEKNIFGKMVFPGIKTKQKVDILTIGEKKDEHVIVRSILKDKNNTEYTMREPLEAFEVGELYKLFFKENYPKEISKPDRHYILTDSNERVIGGLCYKELDENVVLIDGMAVTSPLHGKGIGSAMMEDFFTRMKAQGIKTIKAHFLFGNYYLKHNFVIDKKWGALVREL